MIVVKLCLNELKIDRQPENKGKKYWKIFVSHRIGAEKEHGSGRSIIEAVKQLGKAGVLPRRPNRAFRYLEAYGQV